ncbi:hypothetical protein [Nocardia noduli]|uniref:hypothetical protein n=1 Tax=Nocardia noduli TaxID=2815722 RepID=UPI001C210C39|nr:hypothetical protein [Nocardia noduli]
MSIDWCRHCGEHKAMTLEHLPARATGNSSEFTLYQEYGAEFTALHEFTHGHALATLCGDCNNGASNRGLPQAYTAWHHDVVGYVRSYAAHYQQITGADRNDFWTLSHDETFSVSMEHGKGVDPKKMTNLHPGRIARQVLGGFLAVQNGRRLLDDHPQLQAAYFADGPASIAPLTLHIALANVGTAYLTSAAKTVKIHLDQVHASSASCWILTFSPFLALLVDGEQSPPIAATRIDHWFQQPVRATFGRRTRTVEYPVADRKDLLVAKLYSDLDRLPR